MEVTCQATLSDALAEVLSLLSEDAALDSECLMPRSWEGSPFMMNRPEQLKGAACPISLPLGQCYIQTGQTEFS